MYFTKYPSGSTLLYFQKVHQHLQQSFILSLPYLFFTVVFLLRLVLGMSNLKLHLERTFLLEQTIICTIGMLIRDIMKLSLSMRQFFWRSSSPLIFQETPKLTYFCLFVPSVFKGYGCSFIQRGELGIMAFHRGGYIP